VIYRQSMMPALGDEGQAITPRDEGLARRLKALAFTAPLHDLDAQGALGPV
jgi:hypothetical protein